MYIFEGLNMKNLICTLILSKCLTVMVITKITCFLIFVKILVRKSFLYKIWLKKTPSKPHDTPLHSSLSIQINNTTIILPYLKTLGIYVLRIINGTHFINIIASFLHNHLVFQILIHRFLMTLSFLPVQHAMMFLT